MNAQMIYYQNKLEFETDAWDLYYALNNSEDVVVFDTRSQEAYDEEHIPQAWSFHHKIINEQSVQHLDKSKTYITYCTGIGCNASAKGALKLAELGFKVKELTGGLEWWKKNGYATEGTKAMQGVACNCK